MLGIGVHGHHHVRIHHDRGLDARAKGGAHPAIHGVADHQGTGFLRQRAGAIPRSVVHHDYPGGHFARVAHHLGDCALLVVCRNNDDSFAHG